MPSARSWVLGSGRYTYTFATDITDPVANPCPAPCTDATGKALDLRYDAGLTHRITIQQANRAYPSATGAQDFVPAGSVLTTQREIVATSTCNGCHADLKATAHVSTPSCA
jgi:OmcA/MtrC family decaheme c-type cytochrome